jgi:hypothetical protein
MTLKHTMKRSSSPRHRRRLPWLNLLSIGLLMSTVFLWTVGPSFAQDSSDTTTGSGDAKVDEVRAIAGDTDPSTTTECLANSLSYIAYYDSDFLDFMSEHYLNDDSATELAEVAVQKFEEYKDNMIQTYSDFSKPDLLEDIETETAELAGCWQAIQLQIEKNEIVLRNEHTRNAGVKTTFAIAEKLHEINEGLSEMNHDFAEMLGYFTTFNQKFTDFTD